MKFRVFAISGLLMGLLMIFTGCEKKNPVVAEAGKIKITRQELNDHLMRLYNTGQFKNSITIEEKLTQLSVIMNRKVEFLIAEEEGITNSPLIRTKAEILKEMEMIRYFQKKIIKNELLSEDTLRQYYDDKHKLVEYKQILIGHADSRPTNSKISKDQAYELANQLRILIQNGHSFDSLATIYSDDNSTNKKGGYVGWKDKTSIDKKLADALFSTPVNSIVGPVETRLGYHIIFIINKKKETPGKTFDDMRNEIEAELERKLSFKIRGFTQQYLNQLKKEYNLSINEPNVDKFLEIAGEWNKKRSRSMDSLFHSVSNLILIEGKNFKYPASKLLFQLRDFKRSFERLKNKDEMMKFLNSGLSYLSSLIRAYDLGIDKMAIIKYKYQQALENAAIAELHKQWRLNIKNTPEEIKAYYEQHKYKFKSPEKIEVWEMAFKNKSDAETAYKKLKNNPNKKAFESMARFASDKKITGKNGGYLGYIIKGQRPELSRLAFRYGPNKLIPPSKIELHYYVLLTGDYQPERLKSLEEASLDIDKILFTEKFNKIRQEKINKFKKKINPFTIYEGRMRD